MHRNGFPLRLSLRRPALSVAVFCAAVALSCPSLNAGPSGWTVASSRLSAARSNACAVLLQDGRVLIVGGQGRHGALASVDLYADDNFTSRSPLLEARYDHACALLPDGSVLVAGGRTNLGITDSVEIYDPARDAWTRGPALLEPRAGATASAVKDGRILLAGGEAPGHVSQTLEIYDPVAARFLAIDARLSTPRRDHAAAVLRDGRVFIAGGSDGARPLDSVEIFDPKTNRLTAAGRMSVPRSGLTATTLLSGRVLLLGGNNGDVDLATAETFDPASSKFRLETATMTAPRRGHSAVLVPHNNTVLIVGGASPAESYIPWRRRFQPAGDLSASATAAAVLPLRRPGAVLLAGGRNLGGPRAEAEIASAPTIQTDKADYHPGEAVTFTGSGWIPGQPVEISLVEDPESERHLITTTADADGNIQDSSFSPDSGDLGVTFYVTATQPGPVDPDGAPTLQTAQTVFTDGPGASFNAFGNVNGSWISTLNSQALYAEGSLVPVRLTFSATPGTTYEVTLGFNYLANATAHLGDWMGTSPATSNGYTVTPCTACGTPITQTFPVDDNPDSPLPANDQQAGVLSIYGASSAWFDDFLECGYFYCLNSGGGNGSNIRYATVIVTANASTVVLSYGIHLATTATFGAGGGAGSIPGGSGQFIDSLNGTTSAIGVNSGAIVSSSSTSTTTTAISSSASGGASSGQSVTFTATVTANPSTPIATGPVNFYDAVSGATCSSLGASTQIGTSQTLSGSATASVSTSSLSVGTHTILACYLGYLNSTRTFTASEASLSQTITVSVAATHYAITAPANATAGVPFNITVTAQTSANATATSYTGTVQFSATDTFSPVLPSNYTFTGSDSGAHTFSNGVTLKQAGNRTFTVTDTVNGAITATSANIQVAPGNASRLRVTVSSTSTAGSSSSITVTAEDAYGNTATGYTGTVHFTSSDPSAVLPPDYTFTSSDSGTRAFSATLKTASGQSITVTDTVNSSLSVTSSSISVAPATTNSISVSAPAAAASGSPITVTVTARDQYGNTATSYSGTVYFSSSDPSAILPSNSTLVNGVKTFSVTLTTLGVKTITATDTVTGSMTSSASVTVNPGSATHFTVSAGASATAGSPFTVTVTALDGANNVATGYVGTVRFTSTDTNSPVLPANYTFTVGYAGVHAFTVTLKRAGSQTVTATDTVTGSISGTSSAISVGAASAASLVVSASATATAGTPVTVTVTAKDAYNNTATGYAATVQFTSTDGAAVLPAGSTLTNGAGSFSVTLKTVGSRTVTAAAGSLSGTTGAIAVSSGAAASFTVLCPGPATAGTPTLVVVTALDAYGNTVSAYTGTVRITTSDPIATLPANMALAGGTALFQVVFKTSGSQTATATDTVASSVTGTSAPLLVVPAAMSAFRVTAPTTAAAGTPFSVTVSAVDAYGNITPGYTGAVHLTSNDGNSPVLPADYTFIGGDAGAHTFTNGVTLKTAASKTVTATDTVTPSLAGTSSGIAVSPAAAASFVITAPANANTATSFNITVTAHDLYGNSATGYTGAVHFTSTDSSASLPSNSTLTNGVGTFSVTLPTPGSQTVAAADSVTPAIAGSATVLSVGPPTHFTVSAPGTATAGTAFSVTVTALDSANNVAAGYSGPVVFSSSDAAAVLPGSSALTAGTGSFSVTLKTSGSQTVSVRDSGNAAVAGSATATVAAAATTHLSLSAPTTAAAGTPVSFTVTALDAYGNTTPAYSGTVRFTSSDSQAVLPSNTTLASGVGTFSATFHTAGSRTLAAADTVAGALQNSATVAVSSGPASHLQVVAAGSAAANSPVSVTVTALDAFDNVVTGYTGLVHFTSTDPLSALPADYAFVPGDSGIHTFSLTLRSSGAQTVAVAQSGAAVAGLASVTVVALTSSVVLTAPSANAAYGQPLAFTASVTPSAATGTVTFKDGATTLAVVPLASGAASFATSALAVGSHSILAVYSGDATYGSATSAAFAATIGQGGVTVAVAFHPNPLIVGQPVQATVTVTPSSATGAVRLSAGGVSLASATLASGSATAAFTVSTLGAATIHIAYDGDASYSAASIDVPLIFAAGAPSTISVLSGGAQTALAGQPFAAPFRLRVLDRLGNPTPGVAVTLSAPAAGASAAFASAVLTTDAAGEVSSGPLVANAIAGNYLVTAAAGNATVAVALRNMGALSIPSLSAVTIAAVQGGSSPASVAVPLAAAGGSPVLAAALSGNPAWASVSPQTAAAPGSFTVSFDTGSLAPGTYTANLVLTPAVDYFTAITLPIQLTVRPPSLTVTPSTLTFQKTSRQQVTAAQIVTAGSDGLALSYTAALSSGGSLPSSAIKLDRPSGSTDGALGVIVDFSSLRPGAYSATVRVTPSGASTTPVDLPVQVVVPDIWFTADPESSAAPVTSAALASGQMQFYESSAPAAPRLTDAALTANSDTPQPFQVMLDGQEWLAVSPMRAVTPANLTITARHGSLPPGTYHGKVRVVVGAAAGGEQEVAAAAPLVARVASARPLSLEPRVTVSQSELDLDVTYVVDAPVAISAAPQLLQVSALAAAGPQSVALDLSGASAIQLATAVAGASWVRLATNVYAPGRIAVQVDPTGLTPGLYKSTITLANPGQGISTLAIPVELTVLSPPPSTLVLSSSANPALLGSPITLVAAVQTSATAAGGAVSFYDGSRLLAAVPVVNGQAAYTVTLSSGYHDLRASYAGSNWSATANLGQQIDRLSTGVALRVGPASSVYGQPVTLTADLSLDTRAAAAAAPQPAGEVQFYDGLALVGTAILSARSAAITLPALPTGSHRMTARYVGDPTWNSSESPIVAQTVARAATATTLKVAVSAANANATLTASVSPVAPGMGNPTGSVQFVDARTSTVLGVAQLSSGAAAATMDVPAAQLDAAADFQAVYAGDANFAPSASPSLSGVSAVNAASQRPQNLAPDAIATLYGANLADATVRVRDSAGVARTPSILFTAPGQLNFVVPNVALGAATVEVTAANGAITSGAFTVARVAPGIFTATSDGKGLAAAQIVRVHADGTQDAPQNLSPDAPIDLDQPGDRVFLILYATGLRHNTVSLSCLINGRDLPIAYSGAHPVFAGLDQVNVELPTDLSGAGQIDVQLVVDGAPSNTAQLLLK